MQVAYMQVRLTKLFCSCSFQWADFLSTRELQLFRKLIPKNFDSSCFKNTYTLFFFFYNTFYDT